MKNILILSFILISIICCSDESTNPFPQHKPIEWTPPPTNDAGFALITEFPDSVVKSKGSGSLRVLAAADERVAWVSDIELNIIIKTEDGGSSWKIISPPIEGKLNTIEAIDSLTLWIGTDHGEIFKSEDGGYNWVLQHKSGFINYIEFFDESIGIAMGDPVGSSTNPLEILHTSNGGEMWINKNTQLDYGTTHYAVNFSNPNNGWIRTKPHFNFVFHTKDGGISWDTLYPGGKDHIWTLVSLNSTTAILSYNFSPLRTVDNGISWHSLPNPPFSIGSPSRFTKTKSSPEIVWALYGGLVGSNNFGESWKQFELNIENVNRWEDISSPKKNVVWLSGEDCKVTYTVKADSLLNN